MPLDGMLLPFEPARAPRCLDLLRIALLTQGATRGERGCIVPVQHARGERSAEHGIAVDAEHAAEGLVDEGEAALRITAQDQVRLIVEEIAIARLVLANLPLNVLERFEAPFETIADRLEALQLDGKLAGGGRRSNGGARGRSASKPRRLQPGAQAPGEGLGVGHA